MPEIQDMFSSRQKKQPQVGALDASKLNQKRAS